MINVRHLPACLAAILCAVVLRCAPAQGATQTQYLTLQPGWNAVWLNVDPRNTDGTARLVEEVFPSPAVRIVARPVNPAGTAQFITDPTRKFNQAGWVVWYDNPPSGENTLARVEGNTGYLVFVDGMAGVPLAVEGEAGFFRPRWQAGRYNLLGFNLLSPVSFGEFFGVEGQSAGRHPVQLLFRLTPEGSWTTVTGTELMQPGEAYWIYATQASDFNGPVAMRFNGSASLDFGAGPGAILVAHQTLGVLPVNRRELTFFNRDTTGHSVRLRKLIPGTVGPASTLDALQLYELTPDPDKLSHVIGPHARIVDDDFGELAAGDTDTVTLGAYLNWETGALGRTNLYRIEIDQQYFYLPVRAKRSGVVEGTLGQADVEYTGLWAGTVVFDSVTSLTETGRPIEPTTVTTPMRVLIQVDTNGLASLLSHVTLMQTKTNGVVTNAEPVLVVDDAKIPYFEGIEERDGKWVGTRLATVGYDMPRNFNPTNQTSLVPIVATNLHIPAASVTASNIAAYVNAQPTRPPELSEVYYEMWTLEGGLGPNQAVQAVAAPLNLDAFHRSNPFRHAFHPRHGAGYAITRSLIIQFDDGADADLLQGTYQEQIGGLAAEPLTVQGDIVLQRISSVGTLQ